MYSKILNYMDLTDSKLCLFNGLLSNKLLPALMNLHLQHNCFSPGVNFNNIFLAAFTHADHKSAKRQSSHQCCLALFGPTSIKATHKMLMKLTPSRNTQLINVKCNSELNLFMSYLYKINMIQVSTLLQ